MLRQFLALIFLCACCAEPACGEDSIDGTVGDFWKTNKAAGQEYSGLGDLPPPKQGFQKSILKAPDEWTLWLFRVDSAIKTRLEGIVEKAKNAIKSNPPLRCELRYTVFSDRRIGKLVILNKSEDVAFNSFARSVIVSMNGNPVLDFPTGTKEDSVDLCAKLSWKPGITQEVILRRKCKRKSLPNENRVEIAPQYNFDWDAPTHFPAEIQREQDSKNLF